MPMQLRAVRSPRLARLGMVMLASFGLSAPTIGRSQSSVSSEHESILTIDHYVAQDSLAPSVAGQKTQLYLRERVRVDALSRSASFEGKVVLFVHGAGTPAEVAFDVPYEDYSWMSYLARAGYDVFSVDMTGYGRSTRPHVMNDPCNLTADAQIALGLADSGGACEPSHGYPATTIASDWHDIDRALAYIAELRDVERVSMFGWSLGGPRAGGYAARHPDRVDKLVLLAPAYNPNLPDRAPAAPAPGTVMTSQSNDDFLANWDRQVACDRQYDSAVADSVWAEMMKSDPVGGTWGPGVRRAPRTSVWGWNRRVVGSSMTPTLMIAGIHDAQVTPDRVEALYEDLGAERKVLIDLGCASHNAMWERVHLMMFAASLEWLRTGTVNGIDHGVIRMGYDD